MELNGARVLVTGATGGIGHAIARAMHAEGASLTLTGRRVDVLEPLAEELGATAIAADLSDRSGLAALLESAGPVDVLVANAALSGVGPIVDDYSEEQIDAVLDVNLRAPIILARECARQMRERGSGHVVFIGSIAGKVASPSSSMYNATKFGLRGFALGLRHDLHGTGVGASIVQPGFVTDAGMFADAGAPVPLGRGATPDDVAAGVVKAIRKNKAEVDVAPPEMRAAALLGSFAPNLSGAIQRRTAMGVIDALVETHAERR